jgi:hypothetical protein
MPNRQVAQSPIARDKSSKEDLNMRYYEFTKPSDYTLLEDEINDVLRQLERIWKASLCAKEGAGLGWRSRARDDG